ncbi:phosphotransferase [Bartonella tamiae]|uniref:Aminoglycoside phosphotransferase domain-containing protein n=1 Tax=Bartonella tamiae Th239 TaxID=1094558 RepID=J0QYA0_9HYPH|nr:phosphotransferase [Bartonella tamiae]EJF91076.1 hypothetical protein ME5_00408 [Bartonella tamiae Th239]EJF93259.1 hypothetical protein MEG_01473 [Bartonella tamiae Th307]
MIEKVDTEIENLANKIFVKPFTLHKIEGGLFNKIVKAHLSNSNVFIKKFTNKAEAGCYPPLPTSAAQRFTVACKWHNMSIEASKMCNGVNVPKIISLYDDLFIIVMDEVKGKPLYEYLLNDHCIDNEILEKIIFFLAKLHNMTINNKNMLYSSSNEFKKFKIKLQYNDMFNYIPIEFISKLEKFILNYINTNCDLIHGDINSRNILIEKNEISIIDFEQGQLGEGIYDISYIISEYVIQGIRLNSDIETMIKKNWYLYCDARKSSDLTNQYAAFRLHLAFQTLYRLKGPSRHIWSNHVNNDKKNKIIHWCYYEIKLWIN